MRKIVKFFVTLQRFVANAGASEKEKNRHPEPVAPHFRDHSPPVLVWQHDIDDRLMELGRARAPNRFGICHKIDNETGFAPERCRYL
jgi:hypothetical protein